MKKVSNSSKAVDWLQFVSADKSKLKKYILNKFVTLSEYEVFENQYLDNVTIYESYILSLCGTGEGMLEEETIKNVAILKYALAENNLSGISKRVTPSIVKAFTPFAKEVIEKLLSMELVTIKEKTLYLMKKNLFITSIKHHVNIKKIEAIKPYFHEFNSTTEASVALNLSLSFSDINEIQKDIKKLLKKYQSPEFGSTSSDTKNFMISCAISNLGFDIQNESKDLK
jgi:hypothetical protein